MDGESKKIKVRCIYRLCKNRAKRGGEGLGCEGLGFREAGGRFWVGKGSE